MAEPSSPDEGKAKAKAKAKAKSKMKLVAMGKGEDGEGDLEQEYMLIVVGHGYSPNRVEQIPLDQGKVLSYTSVGQKLYSSQAKQVLDRLRDGRVMRCVEGDPESEPPLPALELYTQPREIANYTVAFQDPDLAKALEYELGYYIFNPHNKGDKVMPLKKFCADCNPRKGYATIRDLRFLLEAVTNHTQAPISHILYLACKDIVDKIPNAIKADIDKTINMELKLQEHSSEQMPMEEKDLQKMMEKTISVLKKEALGLGATNDEVSQCLDRTDRKAALVELICSKQPASSTACRDTTLLSMSVSELELQARNLGAPEAEIDEALDGEDIHASLVDLLFKHQMAREAALQRQTRYIFVGNPATGKSTLLNAFVGGEKARFKSSDRVDGFTSVMKEYYCPEQNATFVDTPGLNDSSIFERARHEISMAFQGKGKSKLVFVFNHQANRCQQDIITLRRILIAFEKAEDLHYGVIVNKHVANAESEKFMLDLGKKLEAGGRGRHRVSVTYFKFQMEIAENPDVKPTLPEDLRTFLEDLPPIDLNNISVESIGDGGLKEFLGDSDEKHSKELITTREMLMGAKIASLDGRVTHLEDDESNRDSMALQPQPPAVPRDPCQPRRSAMQAEDVKEAETEAAQLKAEEEEEARTKEIVAPAGSGMRAAKTLNEDEATKKTEKAKVAKEAPLAAAEAKLLVEARIDPNDLNKQDSKGRTPILSAALNGHNAVVAALISAKADIDLADNYGSTPVKIAASKGHDSVVAALISAQANINLAANDGDTPVNMAAYKGHDAVVAALISAQAFINVAENSGRTPLYSAAWQGKDACVAALVGAKANVDQASESGTTPVSMAAQCGHQEVVAALCSAKADVNQAKNDGSTPLMMASMNGHVGAVQKLLEAKAALDGGKWNPLRLATKNKHQAVVEVLKAAGARA